LKSQNIKENEKENEKEKIQFCTFKISGHLFGVDILDVKEIIDEMKITKIYHAPDYMMGFINIRGQVYLVLNLRILLNFESKNIDSSSRVILFHAKVGESFGVLVDQIGHMVEVEKNRIEYRMNNEKTKTNNNEKIKKSIETGVCKLNQGLMTILNSKQFLVLVNSKIQQ